MCYFRKWLCLSVTAGMLLLAGCNGVGDREEEEFHYSAVGDGVLILNEGNFNSGNATLSYYTPSTKTVENEVFFRANDRKLGDVGQSITLYDGKAYICVENSHIIWIIDLQTFKVLGQITASEDNHIVDPRYILIVNEEKAYVTDLYSPYVNVFNPKTYKITGAIPTGAEGFGSDGKKYYSTEEILKYGEYAFTNCWSYDNKVLVIDTEKDEVVYRIELPSTQPKSMALDKNGKLWVITDGGYEGSPYSDGNPFLYRIDAKTWKIEQEQELDTDDSNLKLDLNAAKDTLYIMNNDVYKMPVDAVHVPVRPFIEAPKDEYGKKHKFYGMNVDPLTSEVYVGDAVDYSQGGWVYRYSATGQLVHKFSVGLLPNSFYFK